MDKIVLKDKKIMIETDNKVFTIYKNGLFKINKLDGSELTEKDFLANEQAFYDEDQTANVEGEDSHAKIQLTKNVIFNERTLKSLHKNKVLTVGQLKQSVKSGEIIVLPRVGALAILESLLALKSIYGYYIEPKNFKNFYFHSRALDWYRHLFEEYNQDDHEFRKAYKIGRSY